MAENIKKAKAPKAKAPRGTLEATFNGKLTKGFTDLRDIVLSVVNKPDDDPKNLHYDIFLTDYKDKFGMKFDRNVYQKIQAEVTRQMRYDTLLNGFDEDGDPMIFFPFQRISWKGNGLIHVVLGEDFKRLLVEKKDPMTYYSIAYTLPMKSKYSKIMFPRLMEHIRRNRLEFKSRGDLQGQFFTYFEPVEQFRKVCGIPVSYKVSHIKDTCRVIVEDIEENTDYTVEVFYNTAQVPTSKKPVVTHICWNLKRKNGEVIEGADYEVIPEPGQVPDQISLEDYPTQKRIQEIVQVDEKSAMSIITNGKRKGLESSRIIEICKEVAKKNNVENPAAYVNWVINGGQSSNSDAASTRFNNFDQRSYDYDEIKKKLREQK